MDGIIVSLVCSPLGFYRSQPTSIGNRWYEGTHLKVLNSLDHQSIKFAEDPENIYLTRPLSEEEEDGLPRVGALFSKADKFKLVLISKAAKYPNFRILNGKRVRLRRILTWWLRQTGRRLFDTD